jgi:hypothetical protein
MEIRPAPARIFLSTAAASRKIADVPGFSEMRTGPGWGMFLYGSLMAVLFFVPLIYTRRQGKMFHIRQR